MSWSRRPIVKLPRPSNPRAETPRKSRTRGRAMDTRRSMKSYIRSPRSVTMAPIGMFLRTLNCAIDLVDRVTAAADR
jgi:hypothetical protein